MLAWTLRRHTPLIDSHRSAVRRCLHGAALRLQRRGRLLPSGERHARRRADSRAGPRHHAPKRSFPAGRAPWWSEGDQQLARRARDVRGWRPLRVRGRGVRGQRRVLGGRRDRRLRRPSGPHVASGFSRTVRLKADTTYGFVGVSFYRLGCTSTRVARFPALSFLYDTVTCEPLDVARPAALLSAPVITVLSS